MKKRYLLDTNILMSSPKSIYGFKEHDVYICDATLNELDGLKSEKGDTGYNAREAIREIDEIRKKGKLSKGIHTQNGGLFRVVICSTLENKLPVDWNINKNDNKIINVAINLNAILITNDASMSAMAELAGVRTESYRNEQASETSLNYTGRAEIVVDAETINKLYKLKKEKISVKSLPFLNEEELTENQYLLIKDGSNTKSSFIARYSNGHLIPINEKRLIASDVVPKNLRQKFALEALLAPADEIPLVILKGPAGTAKTFLALAAGLQKVMEENEYNEVLIFRPNVKFDDDIGYLKGDEMDKIMPLIRPCFDNLKVLLCSKKEDQESAKSKIQYLFDKGTLNAEAMAYLRGRSINNAWVIFDEAQNASPNQILGAVTRAGENTKIVIVGDPEQIDNPKLSRTNNGLVYVAEKMMGSSTCAQVTFDNKDCVRSKLAAEAAKRMS